MGADADSSCTESCTDSWSPDGARNPWSAPTTELWAPTGTNKVYFRISNKAKATELIAYLSHGAFWHWTGLKDRLEAHSAELTAHQRAEAQARIDWFFRTSQRLKYDGPDDDGIVFPDDFQEQAKSKAWETEQLMRELLPPESLSRTLSYE